MKDNFGVVCEFQLANEHSIHRSHERQRKDHQPDMADAY